MAKIEPPHFIEINDRYLRVRVPYDPSKPVTDQIKALKEAVNKGHYNYIDNSTVTIHPAQIKREIFANEETIKWATQNIEEYNKKLNQDWTARASQMIAQEKKYIQQDIDQAQESIDNSKSEIERLTKLLNEAEKTENKTEAKPETK
jgi:predicted  nucleic acid-binding Zn-ribbon protein